MVGKSIKRCALLLLAGTVLQLLTGGADPSILSYPWGVILAADYLYILIFLFASSGRWKFVRSLYDRAAEISSLAAMLVMTLLFGLIRQDGTAESLFGVLGFTRMTSSWIFIIFMFYWMTVMGLQAIDDIVNVRKRKLSTVVMHAAFFVVVTSAFFGSGDKIRVKVTAVQGITVHEGRSASGRTVQLPFSISLMDFEMDEYPPKVHLLEDDVLSQEFVMIEKAGDSGVIGDMRIECLDYIETAGRMPGDSAFVPMNHVGATTAMLLEASDPATGRTSRGWVSCGSHIFDGEAVELGGNRWIVMPRREAKKFLSVAEVADKEGKRRFEIGVNSPAKVGGWKIYQSGYDSERGRWSTVSVLECVRDGWYGVIRVALWMILGAGIWIFLTGWKNRRSGKEDRS